MRRRGAARGVFSGFYLGVLVVLHPWGGVVLGAGALPSRVVSLLPSYTEMLMSLEAEDKIVGVSEGDDPETLPGLPRVGGLKPNWEILVSLQPDLILADNSHEKYRENFERFRLPAVFLRSTEAQTVDEVFEVFLSLGKLLGREERAKSLLKSARLRLAALEASLPEGTGPTVYFEIWPRPLQGCGPASLQGHLLDWAGAQNIVTTQRKQLPFISAEWVAQKSPAVILHTGVVPNEDIGARPGWGGIPAVATGRVYIVDRDKFSRASLSIVDAMEDLLQILYGHNRDL